MDYYGKIADSYDGLHLNEQLEKLKIISENIKVKASDKLLDIGCGTGISTNFFECNATGIDSSREMIKKGSSNLVYGKAEKLPFKDKTFDVILCITAIHNFENPEKALREMLRVKKDRAQIVITLLKKSKKFQKIKKLVEKYFKEVKEVDSDKDVILINVKS